MIKSADREDYFKQEYVNYIKQQYQHEYEVDDIVLYDYYGKQNGFDILIILPNDIDLTLDPYELKIANDIFCFQDMIYSKFFYAYQNGTFTCVEDLYNQGIFSEADITAIAFQSNLRKPTYTDVEKNSWYYKVVEQASYYGLMQGSGNKNTFKPEDPLTRAMVATILYRMENSEIVENVCSFSDVKQQLWYSDAIHWASSKAIVSGYHNGLFGVDDAITRVVFAVMLRNYAKYKGLNVDSNVNLDAYKDKEAVNDYVIDAMKWCVEQQIITGSHQEEGICLNPNEKATRAQCAKMIVRLKQLIP